MGLFEHFPYSNFHDLNLNWIIGKIKNIEQITATVEEQSAAAEQSAADAAASAEAAAGSVEAAAGYAEAAAGSAREAADTVEPFTSTVTEIRARMNAFVEQHSGPADETVLYSSDTPVFSGTVTLSDSLSDYQNIKFVWRHRNDICEQEFKLTGSDGQNCWLRDTLGSAGTGGGSSLWEMCQMVAILGTGRSLQISNATVIDNSGYNDGPVDNTMNTGIMQVIGVRNVADTEVVDARVSADGTTYPTLEERLNAEFSELQGQIESGGLTDEAKNALLALLRDVAYTTNRGQVLYDNLYNALYAVTSITLNTSSIILNAIGSTAQLTATTTPEGGSVTWSSSNDAVAAVDETGLVTAVSYGSATITASAGSISAQCSVVVSAATVTSISAVYTQSGPVYDSDSLDSLKADLVVTASWSDSTTSTVAADDYTLSGTLTEGTSVITVSYGGATTTFNVTVSSLGTLIYNFDFSRSLIDTVQGYEATLINPTYVEQVTGGYKITGANGGGTSGAIKLPVIGNNAVVVIDFGEVTKNPTSFASGHGRLLMYSTSDTGIQNGLIYRNSQYWSWYTTGWGSDTSYTNWSDLSNSRLMMTVDGSNQHTVTVNGVQFAPSVTVDYSARNLYIGSNTSSFRDVTVKSVKIYRTGE